MKRFEGKVDKLCPVCGGERNVLIISLENGVRLITHLFPKERTTKVKVTDTERRAIKLDIVNIFWTTEENGDLI